MVIVTRNTYRLGSVEELIGYYSHIHSTDDFGNTKVLAEE